jgi:hypothetical protein
MYMYISSFKELPERLFKKSLPSQIRLEKKEREKSSL